MAQFSALHAEAAQPRIEADVAHVNDHPPLARFAIQASHSRALQQRGPQQIQRRPTHEPT